MARRIWAKRRKTSWKVTRDGKTTTAHARKHRWLIPDRGKPGRTPLSEQWFDADWSGSILNNWAKTQSPNKRMKQLKARHQMVINFSKRTHRGKSDTERKMIRTAKKYVKDVRKEAKAKKLSMELIGHRHTLNTINGLANLTTDKQTERTLRRDWKRYKSWLVRTYGKEKVSHARATRYSLIPPTHPFALLILSIFLLASADAFYNMAAGALG